MGNGLGFLQAPFPGADLWPGQGGPTGSKAATSCTGCSHSAWRNVTLGDTPVPCWAPAGTSGHSELLGAKSPTPESTQALLSPQAKGQTALHRGELGLQPCSSHSVREWFPLHRAARNSIPAFVCCFPCKSGFLSQKTLH